MPTYSIRGSDPAAIQRELTALFRKHNADRAKRVKTAIARTAKRGKRYVADNTIPIAFKELVDSLEANPTSITADAPHSAAVEDGSRPHKPPLAPLIAWVKLRGMQGLTKTGKLASRKQAGTTTKQHARSIAQLIRAQESRGAVAINAPEQIARAIQAAISKRGTRPHRYMFKAIPFVQQTLYEEVSEAVPDR